MAVYKCNVCGYVYDEAREGKPFSSLSECPVCHQPATAFYLYEPVVQTPVEEKKNSLEYPADYVRTMKAAAIWRRFIRWRSADIVSTQRWEHGCRCPGG